MIKISDGDTLTLLLKGNQQKKLRLAEVDCPENGQGLEKFFSSDENLCFVENNNVC
ncbi:hypothetical protein ACP3T3_20435 [Chryseobacterium sp. CBSDS_008]|uniref:hypothetical protein n=1 Tax=Chryseobacterium sp. CBSDS_008 TaxID=3415265 RepID=UPI003CE8EA00